MIWIAPSERDTATNTLEKRLWDAADQFRANSGLTATQYSQPILGLICFRGKSESTLIAIALLPKILHFKNPLTMKRKPWLITIGTFCLASKLMAAPKPRVAPKPKMFPSTLALGSKGSQVSKLVEYLDHFGYFGKGLERPRNPRLFDSKVVGALARFQRNQGLRGTGWLDKPTRALLDLPRCGVADAGKRSPSGEKYVVVGGWRWNPVNYTFFGGVFPGWNAARIQASVKPALEAWDSVSGLQLIRYSGDLPQSANLHFMSGTRSHRGVYTQCPEAFDGQYGVLAHAFYPSNGQIHFDWAEQWSDDYPVSGIDFQSVALHEIGHALGLGHSSDPSAVMYAYFQPHVAKRSLTSDDIAGIRAIYGA